MGKIKRFFQVRDLKGNTFYGIEIRPGWIERIEGLPWEDFITTKELYPLSKMKILPPVSPSKIVAVGLNYQDHIEELDSSLPEEPVLFFKSPTCIIGPEDEIKLPSQSQRVDYEAELAIIIGRDAWQISPGEAEDYIAGYTCLNDVTARDIQRKDGQWCRAKSYLTFCPIGPGISQGIDPSALAIRLYQNGVLRQESNTSRLLFSPSELVAFISTVMPLYPQDIIATGTPSGIGPMSPADKIEIEIQNVGLLCNYVC